MRVARRDASDPVIYCILASRMRQRTPWENELIVARKLSHWFGCAVAMFPQYDTYHQTINYVVLRINFEFRGVLSFSQHNDIRSISYSILHKVAIELLPTTHVYTED